MIWLNGALLRAEVARIDPADRGFTLGDGVFETIRAEGGAPAHVERHLARLRHGAGVLGMTVPYAETRLVDALRMVAAGGDCALRLTLTRGPMARGVLPAGAASPTVLITAGPLPPVLGPARAVLATCTRRNEFSPLSRIKSLNYGDSILARQEAEAAGADDALLLNTRGDLAEATAATVFLVIGGAIVTPRVCDGALPGIRRALILERFDVEERRITAQMLGRAEAGFLGNALGVRMLGWIDGRSVDATHGRMLSIFAQSN